RDLLMFAPRHRRLLLTKPLTDRNSTLTASVLLAPRRDAEGTPGFRPAGRAADFPCCQIVSLAPPWPPQLGRQFLLPWASYRPKRNPGENNGHPTARRERRHIRRR